MRLFWVFLIVVLGAFAPGQAFNTFNGGLAPKKVANSAPPQFITAPVRDSIGPEIESEDLPEIKGGLPAGDRFGLQVLAGIAAMGLIAGGITLIVIRRRRSAEAY